jgi:hypothetical protein
MKCFAFCMFVVSAFALPATGQETGTLKARFVYAGEALPPKPIEVNKDKDFCGKHSLVDERLLVNAEDKGIRDVILQLFTGRKGYREPLEKRPAKTVTLKTEHCRFEPHVVVLQAGDTLEIVPHDAVGHNANINFFVNPPQGMTVPRFANRVIPIEKAEPAPIPIDCNIHPWMRAYAVILDHPLVAVSDEHGNIVIEGLPTGRQLPFRIFHEAADSAIPEVTIKGKTIPLQRNMLEPEIAPGMNDFGTITIPAAALKP